MSGCSLWNGIWCQRCQVTGRKSWHTGRDNMQGSCFFFFSPPQNRGRDRVSMVDCCQSSLPSQPWNLIRLTNHFGEFAAKACGARMWQNSLFTLNLTMKQLYTLLLQCSRGCAWCCSPGIFQRSNCLLVQFYLLSTKVNILKITLSYIQLCNTGWSICQAKGTV